MSDSPVRGPIISLVPAATEIIAALGAWDRLVAVTHGCDYPPAALRLPRVTSSAIGATDKAAAINAEVQLAAAEGRPVCNLDRSSILALQPSIIVTQGLCQVCAVADDDVLRLAATLDRPPRVISLGAKTFDDVLASIGDLARELEADDEGRELLVGLGQRVRRVHLTLKAAQAPRPRVAVLEWTDPPFAAGHWVSDQVRRAGGIDVLAAPGDHSRPRSIDDIRAAAPEFLLFAPCGYTLERALHEARATLERPEWAWARTLRLAAIDGNAFTSRPGPRLVDGIEIMARLFHPSLFSAMAPGRGAAIAAA